MDLNKVPGTKGFLTDTKGVGIKVTSFEVFEVPKFFPTGEGTHNWGLLEKYYRNTLHIIREIAEYGGVGIRDVGYSGLKDRKARTLQWVSSPGELPLSGRNFQILFTKKSDKKLKRGNLLGNWFNLGIETDNLKLFKETLEIISQKGIPNFFGPQRFSTSNHIIGEHLIHKNKQEAIKLMKSHRIPLTRKFFQLMEDAYGSYLFNKVLSERLTNLTEQEGDLVSRYGPTGPIFGKKLKPLSGLQGEIEKRVLNHEQLTVLDFPGDGKRRALVVPLTGLSFSKGILRFFLPKGSYATSVLRELAKEKQVEWSPQS
ncbi:MAG: tRNA pseudouridine(13) synthase TruD [Candidatus Altiarchaeota archaeon]|nr:tRNA pseudouridine(13) synthase TruD [Candidatus Altiarchaeota archaeon]